MTGSVADLTELVPVAADRWASRLAIVGDSDRLTWNDVERRTRALAGVLIEHGIGRGDRVAVSRLKSNESFESVHAILRAGAAVVPVDPLAPPAVAREIIRDADVSAVIGDQRTIAPLDPWTASDRELRCVIATGPSDDGRLVRWDDAVGSDGAVGLPRVSADDVAYLIYTSGSTGRPKGMVHTHGSGLAYATVAARAHALTPDDRVAGMNPLHFDMSTLELYAAPLAGARVVTISETLMRLFVASFTERCEEEQVTVWYAVPFFLRQVAERGVLDRRDLSSLRLVVYAGEPYPPGALRELMDVLPHVQVMNVYGPAEVNGCTMHVVDHAPEPDDDVPIGRPWGDAEVRIVDESGAEMPDGVAGELHVSTSTVMREYWRRPELSASRLSPRSGAPPWYATGDIVERDDDGVLWFRGRVDHQVKVRGVRLELEAIEAVATDAPGVAHAVAAVLGASSATARIAVAVVPRAGEAIDPDAIKSWCAQHLPPVAIPHDIAVHESFPSTGSGKIDRRTVRELLVSGAPL